MNYDIDYEGLKSQLECFKLRKRILRIIEQEITKLKRVLKKYKREGLLRNELMITFNEKEECYGYYANSYEEGKLEYTHVVNITKGALERFECLYDGGSAIAVNEIRNTIAHELIHAFVFEEFEEWDLIRASHSDYSPIFLAVLYWYGATTNHPYTREFLNSELWNAIDRMKKYDDVQMFLVNYIFKLKGIVRSINNDLGEGNEIRINFNTDGAGIEKHNCNRCLILLKTEKGLVKKNMFNIDLGIGYLVTPELLKNNYKKYIDSALNTKAATINFKYYMDGERMIKNIVY